jgi:type I restriction-modification system DNA methylase subunit
VVLRLSDNQDFIVQELEKLARTDLLGDVCRGKKSGVEENIKVKVVLKVLNLLGYDTTTDMDFEHNVENKKADIALLVERKPKIIVETKSLEKSLEDYKTQALEYARKKGITWVMLTNGSEFRLYKSFIEHVEDRRNRPLITVSLSNIVSVFSELSRYISKSNIAKIDETTKNIVEEIRKTVTEEDLLETLSQSKRELFADLRHQFEARYLKDVAFKAKIDAWISDQQVNVKDDWIDQYKVDKRFRNRINKILIVKKDLDENWFDRYNSETEFKKQVVGQLRQNDIFVDWIDRICAAGAYAFINRLLFLRICEDRGFIEPKLSKEWLTILNGASTHETVLSLIKTAFGDIGSSFKGIYAIPLFDNIMLDDLEWDRNIVATIVERTQKYNFKQITRDIIGEVYQRHIDREVRRSLGQYYTPEPIINFILDQVSLGPNCKILDPACGSGGFLIGAYEKIRKKLLQEGWDEGAAHNRILKDNIFGIDIDSFAVQLTVMNLLMKDLDHPLGTLNIAEGNSIVSLLSNFNTTSPIMAVTGNEPSAMISVGEILSKRYDIVVGNPPYVNISRTNKTYAESIRTSYNDVATGVVNSSSLFVKRGIDILEKEGRLGFIVPKPLIWADSYEGIRRYILNKCRILTVADVGRAFGEEVGYEQVIIVLQKTSKEKERLANQVSVVTNIEDNEALSRGNYRTHLIKQSRFRSDRAFPIYVTPELVSLYEKLNLDSQPLMELADIFRGLPIQREKQILAEKKFGDKYVKILRGKHINRYITENREYVDTSAPTFKKYESVSQRMLRPKIIIQRLVTSKVRVVGTYDYDGCLNFDTIANIVVNDKEFDDKYVLAVINSKVMSLYIRDFVFVRSFLTMDMDRSYIGAIPIRKASKTDQKKISNLVDDIIALKTMLFKMGYNLYTSSEYIKIGEKIKSVNMQIEDYICKIYKITDAERTLIDTVLGYEIEHTVFLQQSR